MSLWDPKIRVSHKRLVMTTQFLELLPESTARMVFVLPDGAANCEILGATFFATDQLGAIYCKAAAVGQEHFVQPPGKVPADFVAKHLPKPFLVRGAAQLWFDFHNDSAAPRTLVGVFASHFYEERKP